MMGEVEPCAVEKYTRIEIKSILEEDIKSLLRIQEVTQVNLTLWIGVER